ncbi:uncharacterized protein LOC122927593 [Bufo gargarizans]|uniref:uncharacterized protein LOC122927593 n=1 Tax=Bufo gargarizans TaxID=30331 RepID=UPI001CF0F499|nr:uncharacterized protein LOC122927593 [Bufo gargarizans]
MDVEKLIVLVQDRPCLWDLRCSEYQDRYKKDAAWEEVTQDLFAAIWQTTKGQSRRNLIEEVKNRWRSCRDQFRKEMRKQGRSGAGLPKKRPYLFREQLMFLRAVMDLRPTEDNLEEDEEESAPQLSSACDEEPTAGQQESLPGPTPGPSEPPAASGADSPPPPSGSTHQVQTTGKSPCRVQRECPSFGLFISGSAGGSSRYVCP